ncbi:bifunctional 3-demethylubiquinone-9 3-methyltransferase/ 2-octaprenyl-6-hydroxy phenol methylase [Escherichia coli K-12]|nr:bifunctional 3-demethylubiquinone-9 3-methyltransferase/ 2-octaprenyl-6-hydroxy phenol methylase [Escherichia coli K-12]
MKPSPPAGGIWKVSSNRCTALTRCVWAILPSVLAVYLAKRCSMSVVAAAFWPRVWRAKARRGLDMGFEPLQVAKLHALESGIQVDYVQETVEEHAAKHAGQYDVVTCMEMLEHVPDPQSVVRACAQLVKPGGDVFFSTLNRNGKSWLMAVVGAEYILRMVPKGTHDVKKFIKPAELLGWVDQTSLKERHITGLHYNPITNTFKLGPGVDVNYMLHTQNK